MDALNLPGEHGILKDLVDKASANNVIAKQILRMAEAIVLKVEQGFKIDSNEVLAFYTYLIEKIFDLLERWSAGGRKEGQLLPFDLDFGAIAWKTNMSMRNGSPDGMVQGSSNDDARSDIMKFSFQSGSTYDGSVPHMTTNGRTHFQFRARDVLRPTSPPCFRRQGRGVDKRAENARERLRKVHAQRQEKKLFANYSDEMDLTNGAGSSKSMFFHK